MKTLPLLLLVLPITASCNTPSGRYQDGLVKQSNGRPCFTVVDSQEVRESPPELAAIFVYELRGNREENIWEADFTKSATPVRLSPDSCIPYGTDNESGEANGNAPGLQAGKRYRVSINAPILKNGKWENRWYRSYFCQVMDAGKLTVHQVSWDKRSEIWRSEVCGGLPLERR